MAISTTEGSYTDYAYTGGMQNLTIPVDGIYKLEAWGAGGGYYGANGGYSIGYKKLLKGETVYIGCGQCGGEQESHGSRFNGGQDGSTALNPSRWYGCRAGGGCTHIALADGVLASLSNNRDKVLIVAGGGGAAKVAGDTRPDTGNGGQGGGLSGGSGTSGAGGTQTSGYAFGLGAPALSIGSDGTNATACSGGGAGWYGGYSGVRGGGGGSAYIDGTPEIAFNGVTYTPSTTIGGGSAGTTNGKARITLVKKTFLPVIFNGAQIDKLLFNGTEITGLQFNGATVF